MKLSDKVKITAATIMAVYFLNFTWDLAKGSNMTYKQAEEKLDQYKNSSMIYQVINPGVATSSLMTMDGHHSTKNLYK